MKTRLTSLFVLTSSLLLVAAPAFAGNIFMG